MKTSQSWLTTLVLLSMIPAVRGQASREATGKSLDERVVECIANKESLARRMAAIGLVQAYRCEGVEASLAAIATDESEDYWLRRKALSVLRVYPGEHQRSAVETLLDDKNDVIRTDAASVLSSVRAPWASRLLRDRLESDKESYELRIQAAMGLSTYRIQDASAAFRNLIQEVVHEDFATPRNLRYLSAALDLLTDPKHRSCLQPFLESAGLLTRARAERAWVRLGGSAEKLAGKNRYGAILSAEQKRGPRYRREIEQIRQGGWEKSTWQEFLLATETVPLVFCGELHTGPKSFRRKLQIQLVDQMSRSRGVKLAVGYEPSVLHVQKSVIDYATSKKIGSLAMEKHWKEFLSLKAVDHRDLECAEIANEYLSRSKAHRLLVLRGQSHVNPNGYLLSKIKVRAVVLFTLPYGLGIPLQLMEGRLHAPGQVLRSRRFRNLWFVSVDMLGRDSIGRVAKGGQELLEALRH